MFTRPAVFHCVNVLRAIPLFQSVEQADLLHLAEGMYYQEYKAKEVLFWEGEENIGLCYLQFGSVKVVKNSREGREQIIRFLEAGETFNEVGAFGNRGNPATGIALEAVGIYRLPGNVLLNTLSKNPQFLQRLLGNMAERVNSLVDLVADLSFRPVSARMARLLLEQTGTDGTTRQPWQTQVELAARLGTVPDVVQRILRYWKNEGIIELERQEIRICKRDFLEKLAE